MEEIKWAVSEVGGGLSGIIIVIQFVVIWTLFRRLNEETDKNLQMVKEMGKEQREEQALTRSALSVNAQAISNNTEVIRQLLARRN